MKKRDVQFAVFTTQSVGTLPEATDNALMAYFEQNKTLYTLPATYNVQFIALSPAHYAETVNVKNADIQAYYNANKAQFGSAKNVHSSNTYLIQKHRQKTPMPC